MAVAVGKHKVGGLELEKTTDPKWPFKVLVDYAYTWKKMPTLGKGWNPTQQQNVIPKRTGGVAVKLTAFGVTLLQDYRWDGNSGPAPNTKSCLRASALHDAWCQAMKLQIYDNSLKNWRRGAAEYRKICRQDGMGRLRAGARYVAVLSYGVGKKIVGRLG